MFLKEFAITRYGPLPDSGKKHPGWFNLFFASNEEGKTLTIDALLKMMFSDRELNKIDGIKRVDEIPEGYLIIGDGVQRGQKENGIEQNAEQKEIKLPAAGTFPGLFHLSALEFRNIFLIRDSDLAIAGEGNFYRSMTNRLTGMRIDEIKKIREKLLDLGRITPGGDFQNTAPHKLKDKYSKAMGLLERIESLLADLEQEEFGRIEEKLARYEERREDVNNLLEQYSSAYNRELYEKGKTALTNLQNALDEIASLQKFNRQDYETWQRAESNLQLLQGDLNRLEEELKEKKELLETVHEKLLNKQHDYKAVEQIMQFVSERIEPALDQYEQEAVSRQGEEVLLNNLFIRGVISISTLVFLLSLAGAIIRPEWWLFLLLVASLLVTAAYGLFRFSFLRREGRLAEIEAKVCVEAEKLDLPAENIQAIRSAIGRLKNSRELADNAVKDKEKEMEWLQREEKRLKDEIADKKKKIREETNRISGISRTVPADTIEHYGRLLAKRQDLNSDLEKQKSILASHFGRKDELSSEEEMVSFWNSRVDSLKRYASAAEEINYDQNAVEKLNGELEKLDRDIAELKEKLAQRGDELRDLEKEINELFRDEVESYLPCQTSVDLDMARKKINQWVQTWQDKRKSALIALDLFSQITAEEEQKVTALFGASKPASRHFSTITAGRYREVNFGSADNMIKVVCADGTRLKAAQLSGGAYDQLYFSIRLALGEELLEGEKGFFILDDPFIKADGTRLRTMLDMLSEISAAGWQVLYFSAKDEVKEALQNKINRGQVKEFSIAEQI